MSAPVVFVKYIFPTVMEPTITGKWLELLKEIAPRVKRTAFLFNPATAPYADIYMKPFKAAAAALGLDAIAAPVHNGSELESVAAAQARGLNGGLVVMPDGFLNVHRAEIISLAARYRLPAIYPWRFFPELGGQLSYGLPLVDCGIVLSTTSSASHVLTSNGASQQWPMYSR